VEETRLYPCLRKEFTPQDTLYLFFQLYGLSEELREGGWVKYTFFKGGKEQHVKKRKIKEYGTGMNFFEEFSLLDFPPSRYLISVSVLNKDEQEVLFREESFTVASEIFTRPWIQFKRYPASGDPVYPVLTGSQLLNKGEMEKAEEELRKAYEMAPEKEDFAIVYARVLLFKKAYEDVKSVLNPFVERTISDYSLYMVLGEAHQGAGEYERAISCYQNYISHEGASFRVLNSIGDCYFKIGNHREVIRAWEKSLEINPNQPEIKKKIETIKSKKDKQ
jgi:tetratricopeptide (TPR) repeat protein